MGLAFIPRNMASVVADGTTHTMRPVSSAVAQLEKNWIWAVGGIPLTLCYQTSSSVLNQQDNIQKLEISLRN